MAQEANALRAMEQANTAMCPHGGSVSPQGKDKQVALANGIMMANAVSFGLAEIAAAIEKMKGGE